MARKRRAIRQTANTAKQNPKPLEYVGPPALDAKVGPVTGFGYCASGEVLIDERDYIQMAKSGQWRKPQEPTVARKAVRKEVKA